MIYIDFYLDGFKINGHANFAKKGYDIVCSAISGISFGSINWFEKKDILLFKSDEKKPELIIKITLNKKNKIGISLIEEQILSIVNSYPKFCEYKKHNKELE